MIDGRPATSAGDGQAESGASERRRMTKRQGAYHSPERQLHTKTGQAIQIGLVSSARNISADRLFYLRVLLFSLDQNYLHVGGA